MTPAPSRPRLHALQYLRALAAIAVLIFHAGQASGFQLHLFALGVDLFFVISGFLMVAITDAHSRPGPFLRDRVMRVVPLYWIATLAWVLLRIAAGGPPPDLGHLLGSLLFIPVASRHSGSYHFPVLELGWTLNYEMAFYVAFAVSLFVVARWRLPLLTMLFVMAVTAGQWARPGSAALAFWSGPIILEFLAGAWLARWWRGGWVRRPRLGWALALVGAPLTLKLIMSGAALLPASMHLDLRALSALPAAMVLAGALLIAGGGAMHSRWLSGLGDASYSIYLWHKPAIFVAGLVLARFGMTGASSLATLAIAGLAAGLAGYWLLERPLLIVLRQRRHVAGSPVPASV